MRFNPMDLSGRNVLVTGATSGIGRETAILLSRLGAKLAVAGRDEMRLSQTLSLLEGEGHESFRFDLVDSDGIPPWVALIAARIGPLYGLVHAAGIHGALSIRAISSDRIEALMRANVYSSLLLVRGLCQKGCHGQEASVVLVSSVTGMVGSPAISLYAATKAAIMGITKSLAAELARDQIRVNCVAPGMVRTELTARFAETLLPGQFELIEKSHLLGLGMPCDVANSIAFLLADTARWITGTALVVDGGYTCV